MTYEATTPREVDLRSKLTEYITENFPFILDQS